MRVNHVYSFKEIYTKARLDQSVILIIWENVKTISINKKWVKSILIKYFVAPCSITFLWGKCIGEVYRFSATVLPVTFVCVTPLHQLLKDRWSRSGTCRYVLYAEEHRGTIHALSVESLLNFPCCIGWGRSRYLDVLLRLNNMSYIWAPYAPEYLSEHHTN